MTRGFDWRGAKKVRIEVGAAQPSWGTTTDLSEVLNGSTAHP